MLFHVKSVGTGVEGFGLERGEKLHNYEITII
jgi:hypothetical protein